MIVNTDTLLEEFGPVEFVGTHCAPNVESFYLTFIWKPCVNFKSLKGYIIPIFHEFKSCASCEQLLETGRIIE